MRDDAFKRIGDNGKYRVVRVQNNYSNNIYRLLRSFSIILSAY